MASTAGATGWLRGRVKAVPSGDSLVIVGSSKADIPPEKTITLSSLIAPKLARRGSVDEPFAWAGREYLRKLCIGKEVTFRVDYTVPSIGREFGSVFLGDKNVALLVVSEGWAKVREQGQQKAEASPFLAELQRLEEQAKQQGLGRWSKFSAVVFLLFFLDPRNATANKTCTTSEFHANHRVLAANFTDMDSGKVEDQIHDECVKKIKHDSNLQSFFKLLDAGFFNDSKVLEVEKAAKEFNIPIIRANRKLVASENGGLHNPSYLVFDPVWSKESVQHSSNRFSYPSVLGVKRPKLDEDIAFMSVLELGQLIKTQQITSEELTGIFIKRLKRYGPVLESVVTITEELAYRQAKEADHLLANGIYLGPLHGIPYGLKDIIAVPHYRTTWGSRTFKEQVLDIEAWVYKRLKSAGAVLVAKLVSGSLAYDDIWFGGRTRNPWNIEEYSTGSSAGPAACTSAGLVPFAIGSETAGSITYPAARCGVTALRPTFGTVGRTGVMSISESLDKLGPFCRSAADCTVVLDTIRGKDPDDISSRDISLIDPFTVDIAKLTVGYLEDAEMEVVHVLKSKGVNMVPFKLNYTVESAQGILNFTMDVDMLAHFDEWQRSNLDDQYEAQDQWPLELRRARVIPAVDYVQAQRARGKLIREVKENFKVDAFVGNATDWERVCVGNLVGMPVIVVPTGFKKISDPPTDDTRRRTTITTGIFAPPDHDHIALALAIAYQSVTDHHKQRPPIDDLGPNDSIPNPPTKQVPPRQLRDQSV